MSLQVKDGDAKDRLGPAREAFRTLLVHVQSGAAAQPRLGVAVELARQLDATLFGDGAEMIDPIAFSAEAQGAGGQWLGEL